MSGIYAASHPRHIPMWRKLRETYPEITASWLDDPGDRLDFDRRELWQRIGAELRACDGVVLYCEPDERLFGALIEAGGAAALLGKPVMVVAPGQDIYRPRGPLGSWVHLPNVCVADTVDIALADIRGRE